MTNPPTQSRVVYAYNFPPNTLYRILVKRIINSSPAQHLRCVLEMDTCSGLFDDA